MRPVVTIAVCVLAVSVARAEAQPDPATVALCHQTAKCSPTRVCMTPPPPAVDTGNCNRCLEQVFGHCVAKGNDPACEAAKAAQYAAARVAAADTLSDCQKTVDSQMLACEATTRQREAECLAAKAKDMGVADRFDLLTVLPSAQLPLPTKISERLMAYNVYAPYLLDRLTWSKLDNTAIIPSPYEESGDVFTVGTRIFLKPGIDVGEVSIKDWIRQIEMAKLFAEYGLPAMRNALTRDSGQIFGLVDTATSKACEQAGC